MNFESQTSCEGQIWKCFGDDEGADLAPMFLFFSLIPPVLLILSKVGW